jgi:hypothetical protein
MQVTRAGREPAGRARNPLSMADPRAQRTLVKSPPELWAEISDDRSLARRLGEFGEIRITRVEAETTVAWEGDRTCGTVELAPAGWGTKVTITAKAVEGFEPPAALAVVATGVQGKVEAQAAAPPAPEPEPAPRLGLLARLLRRGRSRAPEPAIVAVVAPVDKPVPAAASPLDHGAIEAVLVGALDDLGAAHHRPFSRG